MANQHHSDEPTDEPTIGKALKRRGLVAGAAALVVGIVTKRTSEPVVAAATMQFANTATTATNTAAGQTELIATLTTTTIALNVDASPSAGAVNAVAVLGTGSANGPGVIGLMDGVAYAGASQSAGVYGQGRPNAIGVSGMSSGTGFGVFGTCNGSPGLNGSWGVLGVTDVGIGVRGSATGNGTAVAGRSVGGNAVYGFAAAAGATEVVAGVFGDSTTTYGIIGRTTAAGYSGLTAVTSTAGVAALAATSTTPAAFAAYFTGKTIVSGDFIATGGVKSAAVKDATGQHRLVYCVESPESWFEDFGEGTLVNGIADVKLETLFSQIAHTDTYHVFPVSHDPASKGLAVAGRRSDGFTIQEHGGGTSSGTFSYRVVAKRKDIKGERLAKFDLPKINIPDESKLPKPELPKAAPSPLPPTRP